MNKILELVQRRIWIGPLVGLLIGLALGLLIGWVIAPVSWTPNADDILAVADSYSVNNDPVLARARLKNLPRADQERLIKQLVQDLTTKGRTREVERLTNLARALDLSIAPVAVATPGVGTPVSPATPRPTTTPSQGDNSLVTILLIVAALVLIAAIIAILVLRILPKLRARRERKPAPATTAPKVTPATPLEQRLPMTPPPPTTTPGGLGRFVPSYTLGNDNYDTSYSLETPRGEFLGECGMGISETIGEGKPDKVVAFDVWLFDKGDVRTVTQILASEYAYKDQNLRTKLSQKGEVVLAEKDKMLRLETASLRIEARIIELVYATTPNYPPNSHFQKLVVEIVPSLKADGGTIVR
ncbi:MAG: hypothetical protein N2559_04190 [Anaerolineae bacterium]|nr:hypothetical protein [Anaerolineae bacterium]